MKMHKLIWGILICLVSSPVVAQVAKEDFKKIEQVYKNASSLVMNARYSAYANYLISTPLDVQKGVIKFQAGQTYRQIGHIEIIQNKKYTLNVDHQEKSIYLLEKRMIGNPSPFQIPLDTLLNMTDEVKYSEVDKVKAAYDLVFPSAEYSKVRIEFNRKTFFIEKMIFYYQYPQDLTGVLTDEEATEKPRFEIEYSEIKANVSIPSEQFTYEKFLKFLGNRRYVCKEEFKTYKFNTDTSLY